MKDRYLFPPCRLKLLKFGEKSQGLYVKTPKDLNSGGEASREGRLSESDPCPLAILDCPGLVDDFYLNILDWSPRNIVSVALGNGVYSYNYDTHATFCVSSCLGDQYVSAIKMINGGSHIAVATSQGCLDVIDFRKNQVTFSANYPERARIAIIAAKDNQGYFDDQFLLIGGKRGRILAFDPRSSKPVRQYNGHQSEVCGLSLAQDSWTFASGGDEKCVNIWDIRSSRPLWTLRDFSAAVKALNWCPWRRGILLTGAGLGDCSLKAWNSSTGVCLTTVNTEDQITGVHWSRPFEEAISVHGSQYNGFRIWSHSDLKLPVLSRPAHDARLLQSAISPDGATLATAAANDTLKFWRLCLPKSKKLHGKGHALLSGRLMDEIQLLRS